MVYLTTLRAIQNIQRQKIGYWEGGNHSVVHEISRFIQNKKDLTKPSNFNEYDQNVFLPAVLQYSNSGISTLNICPYFPVCLWACVGVVHSFEETQNLYLINWNTSLYTVKWRERKMKALFLKAFHYFSI
jgi:hypothetical protein